MAANLVRKGYEVKGFDLSAEALNHLKEAGGHIADSSIEAVKDADIVITMLPSGKHVSDLYSDEFINNLKSDALLIDSSTIDAVTARAVADKVRLKGCSMIDAPVSGGTGGAQAGTLTLLLVEHRKTLKSKACTGIYGKEYFPCRRIRSRTSC